MSKRISGCLVFLFCMSCSSCGGPVLGGLDDTLTIIGILLAFLFGFLYLARKFWLHQKNKKSRKK